MVVLEVGMSSRVAHKCLEVGMSSRMAHKCLVAGALTKGGKSGQHDCGMWGDDKF
jgi:hypothetical protein